MALDMYEEAWIKELESYKNKDQQPIFTKEYFAYQVRDIRMKLKIKKDDEKLLKK
jgi:hypothetical protein